VKNKKIPRKKGRGGNAVELICLKCKRAEILYVPAEEIPKCPDCGVRMLIKEILREGKSY